MASKQHGFTLLELIVVVAIMGLITSMATEFMVDGNNQQHYMETKKRRMVIREAIHRYYHEQEPNAFPNSLSELVKPERPYILDIDIASDDEQNPDTYAVYRDGWGNRNSDLAEDKLNFGWFYKLDPSDNDDEYDTIYLTSWGMDGKPGITSEIDIIESFYEEDFPPKDDTKNPISYPLTTSKFAVRDNSNQKNYKATQDRRIVICEAIHRYYNHHDEQNDPKFPANLSELVDPNNPYILNIDIELGKAVYRDGWGNKGGNTGDNKDEDNFGWHYSLSVDGQTVYLTSLGMDGKTGISSVAGTTAALYEADYPTLENTSDPESYRLTHSDSVDKDCN